MKEVIDKLIGRLEEQQEKYEHGGYDDYLDGKYDAVSKDIEIVNELAEEYKGNDYWKIIYNKVCELEKKYADCGNNESVNDCIKLENLLQYFKEELKSEVEYTNTSTDTSSGYCEWKLIDEEKSVYKSGCEKQRFYDGNPTESMYEFCPYCGKKIKVKGVTENE